MSGRRAASQRRQRESVRQPAAAARVPTPPVLALLPVALTAAALLVVALGGGMLSDRVAADPEAMGPFGLVAVPAALILAAAALAAAVLQSPARTAAAAWRPGLPGVLSAAFLGWCALSATQSPALSASLTQLAIFAGAVALGTAVARGAREPGPALAAAAAVVLCATVVAGMGINEYLRSWRGGDASWRVFATFAMPNFLAGYLLMALPLTMAFFLGARQRNLVWLSGLALILQTVCLLLTQSRLGLIALVVALAAFAGFAGWGRALDAGARRRALIIAALLIGAGALGARPVLSRLRAAGDQSYSARFRMYTWRGAERMARSHPVLGTGVGAFDVTYPPYAEVGYTQHAHNSFLQVGAEAGLPGALLLMAALAATLAAGTASVRQRRTATAEPGGSGRSDVPAPVVRAPAPGASGLVIVGGLSAIVGEVAHNLFDSDLFVPANSLTLGVVCGVVLALAAVARRAHRPAADAGAWGRTVRWGALALAALLIARSATVAAARLDARGAAESLAAGSGSAALAAYRSAAGLDPWDPEYPLDQAGLYQASDQPAEAEAAYRQAIRVASIGKTHYRFGRFLAAQKRPADAARQFERARRLDPHYLANLIALAEAYAALGRGADAERVYRDMIAQYHGPVGAIRAIPEVVDWGYGIAFVSLAEMQLRRGDLRAAEPNLQEGVATLAEFRRTRGTPMGQLMPGGSGLDAMVARRYERAIGEWLQTRKSLGMDTREPERRRAQFREEEAKGASAEPSTGP